MCQQAQKTCESFHVEVKTCLDCRKAASEKRKENRKEIDKLEKMKKAFSKLSEEDKIKFLETYKL